MKNYPRLGDTVYVSVEKNFNGHDIPIIQEGEIEDIIYGGLDMKIMYNGKEYTVYELKPHIWISKDTDELHVLDSIQRREYES